MANPHKGESSVTIGDKTYTLRFSINALCEMEEELDLAINEIVAKLGDPKGARLVLVRTMFRVGLADKHGEMSDKEAGELIQEIGLATALEHVGKAISAAFPQPEKGNGAGPLNRHERRAQGKKKVAPGIGQRS